jgi:hypothetical protein
VHKIKIEILNAAYLELFLKKRDYLLLGIKEVGRELVGKDVSLAGIARGQAFSDRDLAFSVYVSVRGIKIVEARFNKGIDHLRRLLVVYVAVFHRKPHTTEAKILFYLCKNLICHIFLLYFE